MIIQDLVNGLFELGGSLFVWANVYKLYMDKAVKGIYWPLTFFFHFSWIVEIILLSIFRPMGKFLCMFSYSYWKYSMG